MRKLRVPAHCEKCCHGGGEEKGRGPRRSGKQHTGHKLGDAEEFSGGFTFGASEVGYLVLSNQGNSSGPHTGT